MLFKQEYNSCLSWFSSGYFLNLTLTIVR